MLTLVSEMIFISNAKYEKLDNTSLRFDLHSRRLKVRSRNIDAHLDGALVMTDALLESFFLFLKSQPHSLLILFIYLFAFNDNNSQDIKNCLGTDYE